MLDTVLKIGKVLRESENNLKYHRFIKQPNFTIGEKANTLFYEVDVDENFDFNLDKLREIPENEREFLFYPNLKSSEADSVKKYFFGDLRVSKNELSLDSKQNFKLQKYFNNVVKFEEQIRNLGGDYILEFRDCFDEKLDELRKLLCEKFEIDSEKLNSKLKENQRFVYLVFKYESKYWYEFKNSKEIFENLIQSEFTIKAPLDNSPLVLAKYLYKTLVSTEKDKKTPNFLDRTLYKTRTFEEREFWDLVYAIDYTLQKYYKAFGSIKIYVLPNVENLNADEVEKFFGFGKGLQKAEKEMRSNQLDELGSVFEIDFSQEIKHKILTFDVVISLKGAQTESDLIEIASLEKSFLNRLFNDYSKIEDGFRSAKAKEKKLPKDDLYRISIYWSFKELFNKHLEKKFQNHLLKVLPKIYTGTYFEDPILLSEFIERISFHVRNESNPHYFYNDLKWNFYFLTSIQNLKQGGNLETMQSSNSYKLGLLLGKLASQFQSWRSDCPIKSFEKSYVGNLTRRITKLSDFKAFCNEVHEKLILHDRTKYTFSISNEIAEQVKDFENSNEIFDKELCAFGFFESYFKTSSKNEEEN